MSVLLPQIPSFELCALLGPVHSSIAMAKTDEPEIKEVDDDVLVNEDQVTLHLGVEGVREIHSAHVRRPGLCPFTANPS